MKFLKIILAIIFLISSVVYIYFENSVNIVIEKRAKNELLNSIKNTEPLPSKFIKALEKYYPEKFNQGVWNSIFNQLNNKSRDECQCREIYYPYWKKDVKFAAEILALELEDNFTQKKCYEYIMNTSSFGFNIHGVRSAANYFYKKDINELDENEILKLDMRYKNPSLYKNEKELNNVILKIISK